MRTTAIDRSIERTTACSLPPAHENRKSLSPKYQAGESPSYVCMYVATNACRGRQARRVLSSCHATFPAVSSSPSAAALSPPSPGEGGAPLSLWVVTRNRDSSNNAAPADSTGRKDSCEWDGMGFRGEITKKISSKAGPENTTPVDEGKQTRRSCFYTCA